MEANIIKTHNIVTQEQQTNQKKFNFLIQNTPNIMVELDWDYDCGNSFGKYENDTHEIEFENYFIRCELSVYETGITTSATYQTPFEYNTRNKTVEVGYIELWYKEDEIELSQEQEEKLRKVIVTNTL